MDHTNDYFRPKGRKKRAGSRYWMRDWFETTVDELPKSKWKNDWKKWLDDPGNGLIWP